MRIKHLIFTLLFTSLLSTYGYSQQSIREICVDFRVNSTIIDSSFSNNAQNLKEMVTFLQNIKADKEIDIQEVSFCGAASPEGSYQLNQRLSQGRLTSLEKLIRNQVEIPDSIITRNDNYIPWQTLKAQIEASDIENKAEILSIIDQKEEFVTYNASSNTKIDSRIVKLRQLNNGKEWQQLNQRFFERMRNACSVFITYKHEAIEHEHEEVEVASIGTENLVVETKEVPQVQEAPQPAEPVTIIKETPKWRRHFYLKTNLAGLGLGIANLGIEIDLCKHLSLTIPVYYSAWDYIKPTIKFRTLSAQPELRIWFNQKNDGFFLGAHFGYGYYNLALDGDYRYQDHDMVTPAIGGGLNLGFRTPLGKKSHWKMEFAVGGGFYPVHYDIFNNTEDVKQGLMVKSVEENYIGVDQAAITLLYMFNCGMKGGKR